MLQVDTGDLAEAERFHEIMDGIHAEIIGQHVVIGIARFDNGFIHIHDAVATLLVVAELVVAEPEVAGIANGVAGPALAQLQRRQRHIRLIGRTGRISARQRAVHQWPVRRIIELVPGLLIDTFDKHVRVIRWLRNVRQNVPGGRIDRDQRALAVTEGVFDDFLQLDVDRQDQVVTGTGRGTRERAHGTTAGGNFDFFVTSGAMQLGFVTFFQTFLANVVGTVVVGFIVGIGEGIGIALADATDVTDHVSGALAKRILTEQTGLNVDPRKAIALRREYGDFFIAQAGADRHAFKVLRLIEQLAETAPVLGLNLDQGTELIHEIIKTAGNLGGRDLQGIGRIVARQHDAVTVQNQAAIRRDRHHRNTVFLSLGRVGVITDHLQPNKTRHQHAETKQNQHRHGKQTQSEQP